MVSFRSTCISDMARQMEATKKPSQNVRQVAENERRKTARNVYIVDFGAKGTKSSYINKKTIKTSPNCVRQVIENGWVRKTTVFLKE